MSTPEQRAELRRLAERSTGPYSDLVVSLLDELKAAGEATGMDTSTVGLLNCVRLLRQRAEAAEAELGRRL